jgi:hypothetical protein
MYNVICLSIGRDELAKELDPALEAYSRREAGGLRLDPEQEEAFLARFERVKVDNIMPVMHQIGRYLEEKGHSYQVEEDIGLPDGNPSVTMKIYPRIPDGSVAGDHEFPVISFVAEPDIASVAVEVLNGMPGRPGITGGQAVSLGSLTVEHVKGQIAGLIKRNFGKKSGAVAA